jgi:hypothetical protein
MDNDSYKDSFRDYYLNNKGILFKSFEINISDFHYRYDIYWGDPNVIFDARALAEDFPLAVTTIPHRYNHPNPRIFLHEKLEKKHNSVFELVIAHEIGHLWLHDIVGFNNLSTSSFMNERESEIWADYFSYSYFAKHRHISSLDGFAKILKEASDFQLQIYDLDPKLHMEITFIRKMEKLKAKIEEIELKYKKGNPTIIHLKNAIEITLNALGDIFK